MTPIEEEGLRLRLLCRQAAEELYGLCPDFNVGRPSDPRNGDLASSAALALGGALKRRPSEIAAEMVERVPLRTGERLTVGGKGFLNLYLPAEFFYGLLKPERELPELALPDPSEPDFPRIHLYHRLRRLLELHRTEAEGEPRLLTAPEELRLLRALAWEREEELAAAAMEVYDRLGLGGGCPQAEGARRILLNNGLYVLYGLLRKEKL